MDTNSHTLINLALWTVIILPFGPILGKERIIPTSVYILSYLTIIITSRLLDLDQGHTSSLLDMILKKTLIFPLQKLTKSVDHRGITHSIQGIALILIFLQISIIILHWVIVSALNLFCNILAIDGMRLIEIIELGVLDGNYWYSVFLTYLMAILCGLVGHYLVDSTTVMGVHWFDLGKFSLRGYARVGSRNAKLVYHLYAIGMIIALTLSLFFLREKFFGIKIILIIITLLFFLICTYLLKQQGFVKKYLCTKLCDKCNDIMIIRINKTTGEEFWGCSNFPTCTYTESLSNEEQDFKPFFNKRKEKNTKIEIFEFITLLTLFSAGAFVNRIFALFGVLIVAISFFYYNTDLFEYTYGKLFLSDK